VKRRKNGREGQGRERREGGPTSTARREGREGGKGVKGGEGLKMEEDVSSRPPPKKKVKTKFRPCCSNLRFLMD